MLAVGVTFGLFSWVLLRSNPKPLRAAVGLARYGADASFSLYVTHFPLLALIAAGALGSQRHPPSPVWLGVLIAGYLAAVGYAWLFSRLTEKRTPLLRRALRDRLPGPPTPPAPPAATPGTATP